MMSSIRSVPQLVSRRFRWLLGFVLLVGFGFFLNNYGFRQESTDRLHLDQETILTVLRDISTNRQDPSRQVEVDCDAPRNKFSTSLNSRDHPRLVCRPRTYVVFLKTHKTGSSTVQNIMYRYGHRWGLNFALPRNRVHRFNYPNMFESQFIEGVENGNMTDFNILCNHMRFNKTELSKVMPESTFYFSILRDPVPMMESIFNYYNKFAANSAPGSLDRLLQNRLDESKWKTRPIDLTHNNLVFDLGYENTVTGDDPDVEERATRIIAGIERDFDLILINDHFDESMVMLKHALHWTLMDVVSFRINSRSADTRKQVGAETALKIKRWNPLDWIVFHHFNKTFWARVEREVGFEQLRKEVDQLRQLQAQLQTICLKGGGAVNPEEVEDDSMKPFQGAASVIMGYNLNPDLDNDVKAACERLITPEMTYTDFLYNQQFPNAPPKEGH